MFESPNHRYSMANIDLCRCHNQTSLEERDHGSVDIQCIQYYLHLRKNHTSSDKSHISNLKNDEAIGLLAYRIIFTYHDSITFTQE